MKPSIKISQGREAEIFEWPSHESTPRVLKLFFDASPSWVECEIQSQTDIHQSVVACPRVYPGRVEYKDRHGIVFERAPGQDMLHHLSSQPLKTAAYGRALGIHHVRIHSHSGAKLSATRDALSGSIGRARELNEREIQRALNLLEDLPDGD